MLDDLRHAVRRLRTNPGLTLVTMALLALGLGTSLSALGIADAVLFDPLPYPESQRLVGFYEQNPAAGITQMNVSFASFETWAESTDVFELLSAYYAGRTLTLSGDGDSERLGSNFVGSDYFSMLGVEPVLGRVFTDEEQAVPMARPVVILGYGLWQERFGGRRDVLGTKMLLNDVPFTVVGVLPRDFDDPGSNLLEVRIWLPLAMIPVTGYTWESVRTHTTRILNPIARLKPGVSLAQTQAEMDAVMAQLRTSHPEAYKGYSMVVEPLDRILVGDFRASALALLGAAGFLLLIGCANAAHLLLVQASEQRRSVVLRLALGLARPRLVRQLVFGGVATALPAGLAAIAFGRQGARALLAWSPTSVPGFIEVNYGANVILIGLGLTVATGLVFGLIPVLETRRADLHELLHEGSRGSSRADTGRIRGLLVAAEIATAIVLTAGALLTLDSFKRLSETAAGFKTADLLTLKVDLPARRYADAEQKRAFGRRLIEELRILPGVEAALLWTPHMPGQAVWYSSFIGDEQKDEAEPIVSRYHAVSPGALRELGIPVLRGRGLEPSDHAGAGTVAVISESLARALFADKEPLGRSLRAATLPMTPKVTVVGVAADTPLAGRTQTSYGFNDLYVPFEQLPEPELNLLLRAPAAPTLAAPARQALARLDPSLAVYDVRTMDDRLADEEERFRFLAFLMSGFALLAAVLAALGLYSVIAYSVAQERREIGIRRALGGRARDIIATVGTRAGLNVALGIVVGLAGVALLGRFLTGVLYGVEPLDPAILAGVVALVGLASLAAVLVPVRRALGIDPSVVLRAE